MFDDDEDYGRRRSYSGNDSNPKTFNERWKQQSVFIQKNLEAIREDSQEDTSSQGDSERNHRPRIQS